MDKSCWEIIKINQLKDIGDSVSGKKMNIKRFNESKIS